jgi:hypothetical protein
LFDYVVRAHCPHINDVAINQASPVALVDIAILGRPGCVPRNDTVIAHHAHSCTTFMGEIRCISDSDGRADVQCEEHGKRRGELGRD